MFRLFGRKQREAAQRALDEQREAERNARRELAELTMAANFTAEELVLIKDQQAAASRVLCMAMTNVASMSPAERTLYSLAYTQATQEHARLTSLYYNMLHRKGGIEQPRLN
jgi:hypothetical protein